MEFVTASEDSAKKNKQIKAINTDNSFARLRLIFEIFFERIKDFRESHRKLEVLPSQEQEKIKDKQKHEFRIFYITQGYMLSLLVMDFITNVLIIFFGLKIILELLLILSELNEYLQALYSKKPMAWFFHFTDRLEIVYDPVVTYIQNNLSGKIVGDFIFSRVEVISIFAPALMLLTIYIINLLVIKSIRNNIIELLN